MSGKGIIPDEATLLGKSRIHHLWATASQNQGLCRVCVLYTLQNGGGVFFPGVSTAMTTATTVERFFPHMSVPQEAQEAREGLSLPEVLGSPHSHAYVGRGRLFGRAWPFLS